ncbi:MAG: hypothetical protein ACFB22_12395 [Rhodothalassiaceae bacterium]
MSRLQLKLISCVGVRYDLPLLRPFIHHYRDLGVAPAAMHFLLNGGGSEDAAIGAAQAILREEGVAEPVVWTEAYTSDRMWAQRRALQSRVAGAQDWVISADVDEFHEYPADLADLLRHCDRQGVNCVQGVFIDRVAADGRLISLSHGDSPWQTYPVQAEIMCALARTGAHHDWYGTVKVMAIKGDLLPSRGGHHPLGGQSRAPAYLFGRPLGSFPLIDRPWLRFSIPCRVHHFKWTDTLIPSLQTRLATPGVSRAGAEYGAKILAHLEQTHAFDLHCFPRRRPTPFDRLPWRLRVHLIRRLAPTLRAGRRVRARLAVGQR